MATEHTKTPATSTKEKEEAQLRAQAEDNLNRLKSEFAIANEWGVFPKDSAPDRESSKQAILSAITQASASLAAGDFDRADTWILSGRAALADAQNSRPIWFFGNNRYGVLPILFTAASGALAYWGVFVWYLELPVHDVIRHPAFLGLCGAILKSLYWLQFQINKGLLRPRWFAYFIVAPFVGVLLGGVAGLIVLTGLKLADGNTAARPDWKSVGLAAAFAGFNWEWALEKFRYSAESLVSRSGEKAKKS
jgi:hypothetical protein